MSAGGIYKYGPPDETQEQELATIAGRVTSDAGVPLAYVSVGIASLGVGALTRYDGRYVMVIPGARVGGQQVTLTAWTAEVPAALYEACHPGQHEPVRRVVTGQRPHGPG